MDMAVRSARVALVGNPNSGKTALFNALTGAHQKVANYAGVTVERKEGLIRSAASAVAAPGIRSPIAAATRAIDYIVTRRSAAFQSSTKRPMPKRCSARLRAPAPSSRASAGESISSRMRSTRLGRWVST